MKAMSRLLLFGLASIVLLPSSAQASPTFISYQPPITGGGVGRWSKLWVDPSGQGNDLDGDAVVYQDFVCPTPFKINHIEWWGEAPPNEGFQLEVWKQDPGTIAYQPYGVFRNQGARPDWKKTVTQFSAAIDGSGVWHYSVDLATPISLTGNNAANPRWFFSVIALTTVPYLEWNWFQNRQGSHQCFQWIRGYAGGGDRFFHLGDGRAMILRGQRLPIKIGPTP